MEILLFWWLKQVHWNVLCKVISLLYFSKKKKKNSQDRQIYYQGNNTSYSLHKKWSFPLRIWSYLLKKSLIENFIFCAVTVLVILLVVKQKSLIKLLLIISVMHWFLFCFPKKWQHLQRRIQRDFNTADAISAPKLWRPKK